VAAPSANRSARLSPTTAAHVLHDLGGRVDLILDGGPTPGGIESTVLDLTASPPCLLRPGLVTVAAIEALVGPVARPAPAAPDAAAPLPAPGMLARHYAPRTPLECVAGSQARVWQLLGEGYRVGWLRFAGPAEGPGEGLRTVVLPPDADGYAARLYAALHELDAAGLDRIVVELPPDGEEWLAVHDRLRRAVSKGG
jgi:L-threonylcarbamoyladenylate synthase